MRYPVLAALHSAGICAVCGGFAGKKLRAAARRWREGDGGRDELTDDARALGIDPASLPARRNNDLAVLPQNRDTIRAFGVVQTQWRWTQGVRVGLDYTACQVALAARNFDFDKVLPGLQVMEAAVLEADTEERP